MSDARLRIGRLQPRGIWWEHLLQSCKLTNLEGDYETMADYLAFHQSGTSKSLYKAIIDVHHGQYDSAFRHISKAQSLSYDELQTQLDVGPQVALKTLAKTEMLVELQEVIQYRSQPDLRDHLLGVWRERFKRSHADANSWLKRLNVWTLALRGRQTRYSIVTWNVPNFAKAPVCTKPRRKSLELLHRK